MKLKTADCAAEYKADHSQRVIEGYAAVFGNVDKVGDRIIPGAFKKTLKEAFPAGNIKVCRDHDPNRLIGRPIHMEEDSKGLFVRAKIAKTPLGDETLALIEDGILNRMSIRYLPIQERPAEKHERFGFVTDLIEAAVKELGPVIWACNDEAVITGIKAMQEDVEMRLSGIAQMTAAMRLKARSDYSDDDVRVMREMVTMLRRFADDLAPLTAEEEAPPEGTPEEPGLLIAKIHSDLKAVQVRLFSNL
jgi:HK97 family phage prohead protease